MTSNLVLGEVLTFIAYSFGPHFLKVFWEFKARLHEERLIEVVYVTPELEEAAYDILRAYDGQTFSYVDATSFAIMRQHRIPHAFTLDRDFEIAGFAKLPAR